MRTYIDNLSGTGSTTAVKFDDHENFVLSYTLAGVGTNVVVRVDGSLDGDNWFAFSPNTTHTANGTYAFQGTNVVADYLRFTCVSASGGTPVFSDIRIAASRERD